MWMGTFSRGTETSSALYLYKISGSGFVNMIGLFYIALVVSRRLWTMTGLKCRTLTKHIMPGGISLSIPRK